MLIAHSLTKSFRLDNGDLRGGPLVVRDLAW